MAGGGSNFVGYKHKLTVRYTTLRLDGTWTPAQSITLARTGVFKRGAGIIHDPLEGGIPKFDDKTHAEPIDGYTLEGFQFDRVYPAVVDDRLILTGRNFSMRAPVDFYRKLLAARNSGSRQHSPADGQVLCSRTDDDDVRRLYYGVQDKFQLEDFAQTMLIADQDRLDITAAGESESALNVICATEGLYKEALARLNKGDNIEIINGAVTDAIVDSNGDLLLLQGSVRPGPDYLLKRLGTTLTEKLVRTLFMTGVDGLLDLATQKSLKEKALPLSQLAHIENAVNAGKLDFKGPYGTYYREVFFHIPFLIANFLNSQGQFAASQDWYYFIFNPTSTEQVTLPPNLSPEERAIKLNNRVWRYLEFRDLAVPKLQDILGDPETIEIYRKDPFNPHALARLRLSAYQKCIVMKVIDNWLDWGDHLFAQFTTESLHEATMLYVMAADVLGPRPAELGSCGEAKVTPRNYETIGPLMKAGEGFLAEIETLVLSKHSRILSRGSRKRAGSYVLRESDVTFHAKKAAAHAKRAAAPAVATAAAAVDTGNDVAYAYGWQGTYTKSWAAEKSGGTKAASKQTLGIDSPLKDTIARAPGFTWSVARQIVPVFCVPPNKDLLAYWDRVEDRLYKLRHCLDINGVFRRPALFAPEIDPRLLVRARAAGLSLDDVLNATSGNLPPYRFSYLIEKTKQYTGTLQGFGGLLLSALEKKDLEGLTRLRTVHQQNLLKMTTRMREWDITIAADTITALERQQAAVQYRREVPPGAARPGIVTVRKRAGGQPVHGVDPADRGRGHRHPGRDFLPDSADRLSLLDEIWREGNGGQLERLGHGHEGRRPRRRSGGLVGRTRSRIRSPGRRVAAPGRPRGQGAGADCQAVDGRRAAQERRSQVARSPQRDHEAAGRGDGVLQRAVRHARSLHLAVHDAPAHLPAGVQRGVRDGPAGRTGLSLRAGRRDDVSSSDGLLGSHQGGTPRGRSPDGRSAGHGAPIHRDELPHARDRPGLLADADRSRRAGPSPGTGRVRFRAARAVFRSRSTRDNTGGASRPSGSPSRASPGRTPTSGRH